MMNLSRTIGLFPIAGALWYFKDPARRAKFLKSGRQPCEIENNPQSLNIVETQQRNTGATPHKRNRGYVVSGSVFAPGCPTRPDWYNNSQGRSWWQQLTIFAISPPTPSSDNEPPEEGHWKEPGFVPPIPNAPLFEDMPIDQFIDDGIDRMFDDDSDIEVNVDDAAAEEVGEVDPQGAAEVAIEASNVNLPTGEAAQQATSSRAGMHDRGGESSGGQFEPRPGPSSSSEISSGAENPPPQGDGSVRPHCQSSPAGEDNKHA